MNIGDNSKTIRLAIEAFLKASSLYACGLLEAGSLLNARVWAH
jgi:hypothetical protein